jgi:hypothetical protein
LVFRPYTPQGAAVQTFVLLAIEVALIIGSTIITTRLNNLAVVFALVGMVELSIVLFAAALLAGQGDWDNLWSTGTVPAAGWFSWLGRSCSLRSSAPLPCSASRRPLTSPRRPRTRVEWCPRR